MLSAGNDIVALSEIDVTRTNTRQFYSKILSISELALYEQLSAGIPFVHYVWLLWSIKESAYKFLKRIDVDLVFTPVKFEVQQLHISAEYGSVNFTRKEVILFLTGVIQIDSYELYSKSFIEQEMIWSVVDSDELFSGVCSGTKLIKSTDTCIQSAEVRKFLINELKKHIEKPDITVYKSAADVPILFSGQEELPIPISLSHHGHYVAYSFKLNS